MVTSPTIEVDLPTYLNTPNDWFRLDDATRGQLGSFTYFLAGPVPVDISCYSLAVSVRRGGSLALHDFQAGTCSVTFRNSDRDLDPAPNVVSDGMVRPGVPLRVKVGATVIFEGRVDSRGWQFGWSNSFTVPATVSATDDMAGLAHRIVQTASFAEQTPGERIAGVLASHGVEWPAADQSIDEGVNPVAAQDLDGVNALSYCQQIARGDLGRFFAARSGELKFRDRRLIGAAAVISFNDTTGPTVDEVAGDAGTTGLYTEVLVTSPDNERQEWRNELAERDEGYGRLTLSVDTVLSDERHARRLSNHLGLLYGEPNLLLTLSINADDPDTSAGNRVVLAGLELGDRVDWAWTPSGFGTAWSHDRIVENIEHRFDGRVGWSVGLLLSALPDAFRFVIGDATSGVVGSSQFSF